MRGCLLLLKCELNRYPVLKFNFHNFNFTSRKLSAISFYKDNVPFKENRHKSVAIFSVRFNSVITSTAKIVNDSIFYKLSTCQPVAYVQQSLLQFHETSGLPWWATIILATTILRFTVALPLSLYQTFILAKVENISMIDMPDIAERKKKEIYLKAKEMNWTPKEATINFRIAVKKEWNTLIVQQNCHPFKATIPFFFQIPLWIFLSSALRNLAYMLPQRDAAAGVTFMELSVGGFLWVPNLTSADTTFILPVALGLSNLLIIEIQQLMRMRELSKTGKFVTNLLRGFSLIIIPISSSVPSCLCLYWTTSSVLALLQNLLLMSNRVRSAFKIPDTPTTLDRPYSHLVSQISHKFSRS